MNARDLRLFAGILFVIQGSLLALAIYCLKDFPYIPPVKMLPADGSLDFKEGQVTFFWVQRIANVVPNGPSISVHTVDGVALMVERVSGEIEFSEDGIEYRGATLGRITLAEAKRLSVAIQPIFGNAADVTIAYRPGGLSKFFMAISALMVGGLGVSLFAFAKIRARLRGREGGMG